MIDKLIETAQKLNLTILDDLSHFPLVKNGENIIPYLFAKQNYVLPVEENEGMIIVAVSDPLDFSVKVELELLLKKEIKFIFTTRANLEKSIEKCYKQKEETNAIFSSYEKEETEEIIEEAEGYDLLESFHDNPVVRMLNAIIIEAFQQGASDIHFEPSETGLILRYRIDGVLQKRASPPKDYQNQLLTRLKVVSKLDIAEKRRPQDGRIKLRMGKREIDFRVSTIPVVYGERIALRILDKSNIVLGIDNLGMSERVLSLFKKLIYMPEGILLVTGPTGSGKTTTLYSAIQEINNPGMNIMTIEDPVEYKLSSIAQIGVNQKIGLSFSAGLRHILRQDPDAIMIGEIRDQETAEIAIQAALTGHLVLTTLHTNDAPSAIARLVEMGMENYLLSSSIIGVLAQRLVRLICPHCKVSYEPSPEELKRMNVKRKDINLLYRGEGCSHCFHTGYKGRHGIYELMGVTIDIKKQIMKSPEADSIRKIAFEQDMKDLFQSGLDLVKEGKTTTDEVFRVAKTFENLED